MTRQKMMKLLAASAPLAFARDESGPVVTLPDQKPNSSACTLKITAKS